MNSDFSNSDVVLMVTNCFDRTLLDNFSPLGDPSVVSGMDWVACSTMSLLDAEFRTTLRQWIEAAGARGGNMALVTQVLDVSEVRLVNCAADQIAVNFSPEGFVDVEGGPQTVSVSELEVLRLISQNIRRNHSSTLRSQM